MPITAMWENEDRRIVVITCSGRWTWDEVYAVNDQINEMVKRVDHRTDTILDLREGVWFEPNIAGNVQTINSHIFRFPGVMVFVGNSFAWDLFNLFCQHFGAPPYEYDYAPTMKAAREIIRQRRLSR
jgi:hypothetical protein